MIEDLYKLTEREIAKNSTGLKGNQPITHAVYRRNASIAIVYRVNLNLEKCFWDSTYSVTLGGQ